MKFTTALAITALLVSANLGLVNRASAENIANAEETPQESAREQIESTIQPQECSPFGC
ncbi:MAG: hypothetical protein AB4058_13960 [Microcystaceae cyanobacterium]